MTTASQLAHSHRWRIEEPNGPTAKGVCTECKKEREFFTSGEYKANWKYKEQAAKGRPETMTPLYLGIDPGLDGALAVICPSGDVHFMNTPTLKVKPNSEKRSYDLRAMWTALGEGWARSSNGVFVCIETQQSMPGMSAPAVFSTGFGYGLWVAFLTAGKTPWMGVRPHIWKRRLEIPKGAGKDASLDLALRLFPGAYGQLQTKRGEVTKKDIEGRADALLLAEFGRRQRDG